MRNTQQLEILRQGVVAGAMGGLTEIAWVALYASTTGADARVLARGVTSAAGVGAILPASPVALGIAVHMTLAVTLGVALAFTWRALRDYRLTFANPYPLMLTALAGVWALNFFVVLPIISPGFVHVAPYLVSLISKLLFGTAAAETLRRRAALDFRVGQHREEVIHQCPIDKAANTTR